MSAASRVCRLAVWAVLAAGVIHAGCAIDGGHPAARDTVAGSGIDWIGLAGRWPGAAEHRVDLVTFVEGRTGERQVFRFDTQLAAGRLVMVAQTPLGVPLYRTVVAVGSVETVYYDERLRRLPVEGVLADFVLAYWPMQMLAAAAGAAGYTARETDHRRQLVNAHGRILVEIETMSAGTERVTTVSHHDIPLTLSIRSIERSASGQRSLP